MRLQTVIKIFMLISLSLVAKSMIVWIFLLILTPSLRQKTTIYMTKSYYYQVYPVLNSCLYWCVAFTFSVFGNLAIVLKDDSFLHIINPFIN